MGIHVRDITWTRSCLEVEYTAGAGESLVLYRVISRSFAPFSEERERLADGSERVRARLNLVVAAGREPLEQGDWFFCTRLDDEVFADGEEALYAARPYLKEQAVLIVRMMTRRAKAFNTKALYERAAAEGFQLLRDNPYDVRGITYAPELLVRLEEELSRVFRYGGGNFVYTASLVPRVDRSDYVFVALCLGFYQRQTFPKVRFRSLRFWEGKVLSAVAGLYARLVPRNGKRVLFMKENGEGPTANMAAVRDRMRERGLDGAGGFEVRERYRNTFKRFRQSLSAWLGDIHAIARSDFIFVDDYCPIFNYVRPRAGQVLTQVWHAGVGFKSVGYARFGINGSPDPFRSSHRNYTYALVGNEHLRQTYSEVYGIEESALLATGMPRLDHFLDADVAERARADLTRRYPWLADGRVIVFAPTFRGPSQALAYYPYEVYLDIRRIHEMCEATDSYFVFEMHHFVKEPPPIPPECADRVFDLTSESLDALYHVADVLVTDYSSCFYDFVLLEKPVVFFVPDKVDYAATRGVQRGVDETAPGVVCDTFERFIEVLESGEYAGVEPDPSVIDRAAERGMLASDRVIDTVLLGRDVPGVRMEPASAGGRTGEA